jgi:hypothetical protein
MCANEKDIEIGFWTCRTLKIFGCVYRYTYLLANQKREVSLSSQSNKLKIVRQQLPMDQEKFAFFVRVCASAFLIQNIADSLIILRPLDYPHASDARQTTRIS